MTVTDGRMSLDLSVTDLRLYGDEGSPPEVETIRGVADRLAWGVPALLSVGLTRPFSSRPDESPVHWLQVNNIHLADDPAWRLASNGGTHPGPGPVTVEVDPDELPF